MKKSRLLQPLRYIMSSEIFSAKIRAMLDSWSQLSPFCCHLESLNNRKKKKTWLVSWLLLFSSSLSFFWQPSKPCLGARHSESAKAPQVFLSCKILIVSWWQLESYTSHRESPWGGATMSFKPYSRLPLCWIPYWEYLMMLSFIQWKALYSSCYPNHSLVPLDYLYLDTFAVAIYLETKLTFLLGSTGAPNFKKWVIISRNVGAPTKM